MKHLTTCVGIALSILVLGLSSGWADEIKWKAQTAMPPEDSGTRHHAKALVEATNKALDGKLHTKLFQLGQLVPEGEMGVALSRGVYDAAYMPAMARTEAGNVAFGLPFSWESLDDVMAFYYDYGFLEWMREHEAGQNVFFGCPLPWGPVALFSNFPVHTLDDYKGKKIWSWGLMSAVIEAFGAKPVWFDPGEIYMALKLGTIDGVLFGPAELETMKLKEVVKYINLPAIIDPLVLDWSVNLDSWNELTPEMKATYEKVMRENIRDMYDRIAVENQMGFDKAEEAGVEIVRLDEKEEAKLRKIARDVWEIQSKKGKASAEAVDMLRAFLKSRQN
ncbi:MAG: TRAP transporter substrate-binding protein DctP [Deltaproteobacteria bacterium]|nr:TRAP transporter substrate-binding protein DctP [Deltaproteobacteria bacterium]